jgi:hypothetical protein
MAVTLHRKPGAKPGAKPKFDWAIIRNDFVQRNLLGTDGKLYTLEECAQKWGISYGRLRNVAASEKWIEQVKADKVKLIGKSLERAKDDAVFNEVEIRTRQATYAKLAQTKAILRLQAIEPDTLTVREATLLLQLGFISERKALGLPDTFSVDVNPSNIISRAHEIFERKLAANQNVEKALAEALRIIDTEFEEKSDEGINRPAVL